MRTLLPSKSVGARREAHMWTLQHGPICSSQLEPPPTRRSYKFAGFPPQQSSHPPGTAAGSRLEAPLRGAAASVPATGSSLQSERPSHIKAQVAQRLHISEQEADRRLQQLQQLLPGLDEQLHRIEPAHLAHMASDVTAVAARLLQLRAIFPNADAFKLALREPFLVYGSTIFRLQRAASELRSLLPGLDIDRLVEDQPSLLDVRTLRKAIRQFRRAEPSLDVAQALQLDPSMPFRFSFRTTPNLSLAVGRRTALQAVPVPSKRV